MMNAQKILAQLMLCQLLVGCGALPRPTALTEVSEPDTRASTATGQPDNRGCRSSFPAELREAIRTPQRTKSQIELQRAVALFDELEPCAVSGKMSKDDHWAFLLLLRRLLDDWYGSRPQVHAGILSGESRMMIVAGDETKWATGNRGLSAYVLAIDHDIDALLRHQDDGALLSSVQMTGTIARHRLLHAMMRTDAATGVAMGMLLGGNHEKAPLDDALTTWGDAIGQEAGLWNRDVKRTQPQGSGSDPEASLPTLEHRFYTLSLYARALGNAWRHLDGTAFRRFVGRPYGQYVQSIFDAERGNQQHSDSRLLVSWVAALSTDDASRPRSRSAPLRQIVKQVVFDDYNTRALIAMLEAEEAWSTLFEINPSDLRDIDEAIAATYSLAAASALVDNPDVRLSALARVVTTTGINDGHLADVERGSDGVDDGGAALFHKLASRQLAEMALCLMNRTYVDRTNDGSHCVVALSPHSHNSPDLGSARCDKTAIHQTRRRIGDGVRHAYETMVGTIESHWDVAPSGAQRRVPMPRTICELERVSSLVSIGRLVIGLPTYYKLLHLAETGRISLDASDTPVLLRGAFTLARQQQEAACSGMQVVTCNAHEVHKRVEQVAKRADQLREVESYRDRFCEATTLGSMTYAAATSDGRGPALLQIAVRRTDPVGLLTLTAEGMKLQAESRVCARWAAKDFRRATSTAP